MDQEDRHALGLLEHGHHVQAARERLFRDHAHGHDMTIYGEPSPALAALMERMAGHVAFHRHRPPAGGEGPRRTSIAAGVRPHSIAHGSRHCVRPTGRRRARAG